MPHRHKIAGKVAMFVDDSRVAINKGVQNGVEVGMLFAIQGGGISLDILDPETKEKLGTYEQRREKCRVRVTEVQEHFAICENTHAVIASWHSDFLPLTTVDEDTYVKIGDDAVRVV